MHFLDVLCFAVSKSSAALTLCAMDGTRGFANPLVTSYGAPASQQLPLQYIESLGLFLEYI